MFTCADVACAVDLSSFAVLVIPKSSSLDSNESKIQGRDGVILLFNATDPIPVATWLAKKV